MFFGNFLGGILVFQIISHLKETKEHAMSQSDEPVVVDSVYTDEEYDDVDDEYYEKEPEQKVVYETVEPLDVDVKILPVVPNETDEIAHPKEVACTTVGVSKATQEVSLSDLIIDKDIVVDEEEYPTGDKYYTTTKEYQECLRAPKATEGDSKTTEGAPEVLKACEEVVCTTEEVPCTETPACRTTEGAPKSQPKSDPKRDSRIKWILTPMLPTEPSALLDIMKEYSEDVIIQCCGCLILSKGPMLESPFQVNFRIIKGLEMHSGDRTFVVNALKALEMHTTSIASSIPEDIGALQKILPLYSHDYEIVKSWCDIMKSLHKNFNDDDAIGEDSIQRLITALTDFTYRERGFILEVLNIYTKSRPKLLDPFVTKYDVEVILNAFMHPKYCADTQKVGCTLIERMLRRPRNIEVQKVLVRGENLKQLKAYTIVGHPASTKACAIVVVLSHVYKQELIELGFVGHLISILNHPYSLPEHILLYCMLALGNIGKPGSMTSIQNVIPRVLELMYQYREYSQLVAKGIYFLFCMSSDEFGIMRISGERGFSAICECMRRHPLVKDIQSFGVQLFHNLYRFWPMDFAYLFSPYMCTVAESISRFPIEIIAYSGGPDAWDPPDSLNAEEREQYLRHMKRSGLWKMMNILYDPSEEEPEFTLWDVVPTSLVPEES